MKSAFTMIELIFVIVIIGVLAAVGIPKFALVRGDATSSVIALRLSNCIGMASKGYLEDGVFDINDTNCHDVVVVRHCFTLTPSDDNGTLNIKDVSNADKECKLSQKITFKNGLSSATGVTHNF